MGSLLSPQYGQVILVNGYPVLTAVNWSQHGCAISGCTWAPKLARCQIKHWFPCGAEGQSIGRPGGVRPHDLPNFLGWIDFYGATLGHARSTHVEFH